MNEIIVSNQFFTLLFLMVFSSFTWHIMLKGRGNVDNLWLFGLLLTLIFNVTVSVINYFPFVLPSFFTGTILFMIFTALYIYSFPRSVWPGYIWGVILGIIAAASKMFFLRHESVPYISYFFVVSAFAVLYFVIIFRKIKYLEINRKKSVVFYTASISFITMLFVLFSGISVVTYNVMFYRVYVMTVLPLSVAGLILAVYRNMNTRTGINTSNVFLLLLFSVPGTFFISRLMSFRALIARYIETGSFTAVALTILFVIISLLGIVVSIISTVIEGFIDRSRVMYQSLVNDYRLSTEKVTSFDELFDLYRTTVKKEFPNIRLLRFVLVSEKYQNAIITESDFLKLSFDFSGVFKGSDFSGKPYFVKSSADMPAEIINISKKYGGDVFMPVVFKSETIGFMVINTRKISHSELICVYNITTMTITMIDKIELFQTVLETEKKLEASRHFRETGKMVSFIAHELRSPLSSILFNMEVIKDHILNNKEIDTEYLDISLKEMKRLNEIVEKMLTYGRNVKLLPVSGKVTSFFDDISHLYRGYDHTVEFADMTDGREFTFDWDVLKSVLINLITNSIQALDRVKMKGVVKVSAYSNKTNLIFEVADNGPGVPDEHKDSIFEPFYTTRKEGNGLGLATCEKIAKLSGGRIFLKSTSKEGSTFQISLPVS